MTALAARFTSVRFSNYKALRKFSVSLERINILVGANNAGKSTILGAFRILSEGLRRAATRKAQFVNDGERDVWGYPLDLADIPISTENIFTDYDDSNPAKVVFRVSNGNELILAFPSIGSCVLLCNARDKVVRTPAEFQRAYPVRIGFVPVLGPVEHNEPLYQREAARKALLMHRASRNFRNIWYHYPDDFTDFRGLITSTWPGMDIEPPQVQSDGTGARLVMFCPEQRYPREIFWAGFGFQVWCQMLTYIMRAVDDSLLVIDEPDIYLHSDLQRQLLSILDTLGPDILVATHSTEMISEAEPRDLLLIRKGAASGKRLTNVSQLQTVFGVLGSNANPILTQLAKSRRVLSSRVRIFSYSERLQRDSVSRLSRIGLTLP
jgi:energy-coupling factor transporter ATP-binding protein EcfA2